MLVHNFRGMEKNRKVISGGLNPWTFFLTWASHHPSSWTPSCCSLFPSWCDSMTWSRPPRLCGIASHCTSFWVTCWDIFPLVHWCLFYCTKMNKCWFRSYKQTNSLFQTIFVGTVFYIMHKNKLQNIILTLVLLLCTPSLQTKTNKALN